MTPGGHFMHYTKHFVLLPIDIIRILTDAFPDGNGVELTGYFILTGWLQKFK